MRQAEFHPSCVKGEKRNQKPAFVEEPAGKISPASLVVAAASFFHLNSRCPPGPEPSRCTCWGVFRSFDLAAQTDKEVYDSVIRPKETPALFQKARKEKHYGDATWSSSTAFFWGPWSSWEARKHPLCCLCRLFADFLPQANKTQP